MDSLKVLENIDGLMGLYIEVTLSRDIEMGMVIGNHGIKKRVFEVIICWIENMDMDNIVGAQGRYIRGFTLRM